MSELVELGGLWTKTSTKGQEYLSCLITLEQAKKIYEHIKNNPDKNTALNIFDNHKKTKSSQPDKKMFLSSYQKKDQPQAPRPVQNKHLNETKAPEQSVSMKGSTEVDPNDIKRLEAYIISFGKYKNQHILSIPSYDLESYLNWMKRQPKQPPNSNPKIQVAIEKSRAEFERMVRAYVWADNNGQIPQEIKEVQDDAPWPDEPPPSTEELPF